MINRLSVSDDLCGKQYNIYETGKELQKRCSEMIENMTAFNMGNIDIEIRNIK